MNIRLIVDEMITTASRQQMNFFDPAFATGLKMTLQKAHSDEF